MPENEAINNNESSNPKRLILQVLFPSEHKGLFNDITFYSGKMKLKQTAFMRLAAEHYCECIKAGIVKF